MSPTKRLLRSDAAQSGFARAAALYIRFVLGTTRWTMVRAPEAARIQDEERPYICCFWHGRLMITRVGIPFHKTLHMLISAHRDGVLISRAIGYLGIRTVAGSSKKGGTGALRAMQRLLKDGQVVGITPDGPRGPRMRAKPGAIKIAQLSGAPLLPMTAAVGRRRILNSWDRFCLALPFSRGVAIWGEPIHVPRSADEAECERLRRLLEDRLNEITAEADRRLGHAAIEPAALPEPHEEPGHAPA